MAPQWDLDAFARRLIHAGVRRRRAQRLVAELRSHLLDLQDEEQARGLDEASTRRAAECRLGDPDQVFDHILRGYRRETFVGRHPFIFFAICPAVAVLLGHTLGLLIIAFPRLAGWHRSAAAVQNLLPFDVGGRVIAQGMPVVLAAAFALTARRLALRMTWRIVPACVLASTICWVKLTTTFSFSSPRGSIIIVPSNALPIIANCLLALAMGLVTAGLLAPIHRTRLSVKAAK